MALMANLGIALIKEGRIKTTLAKAKALRPFAEKLITLAKSGTLADRRLANSRLRNKEALQILFNEKVEEFRDRPGGYTRIYKIGNRIGDAAEMAIIELIPAADEGYGKKKKKKARKAAKKKTVKAVEEKIEEPVAEAAGVEEAVEVEEATAEAEDPTSEAEDPTSEAEETTTEAAESEEAPATKAAVEDDAAAEEQASAEEEPEAEEETKK